MTPSQAESSAEDPYTPIPSLRQRNPAAYWMAILCVVAMVLSTVAVALSAILS